MSVLILDIPSLKRGKDQRFSSLYAASLLLIGAFIGINFLHLFLTQRAIFSLKRDAAPIARDSSYRNRSEDIFDRKLNQTRRDILKIDQKIRVQFFVRTVFLFFCQITLSPLVVQVRFFPLYTNFSPSFIRSTRCPLCYRDFTSCNRRVSVYLCPHFLPL